MQELALNFARKCYTQLELYCFKDVFRSLAEEESGIRYWSEPTLCRFLEIPDTQIGAVLHQMSSNLASFPFMSQGPSILSMEAMMRVVTLMTDRYRKVLKRGGKDRLKLIFSAIAVFDRRASVSEAQRPKIDIPPMSPEEESLVEAIKGFDIDQPANDNQDDDDDDDELALAALDSLDAIEAISLGERRQVRHSFIPADNFRRLVELLIMISPLKPQEKLSLYFEPYSNEDDLRELRDIAGSILKSFDIEGHPGIMYNAFKAVVPNSLPFLFNPLSPLFEHFLFQRDFDLSKRKESPPPEVSPPQSPQATSSHQAFPEMPSTLRPMLEKPGEVLTNFKVAQLSFFLPPEILSRRLFPLYSSSEHGFSMGSFENNVFHWNAQTLLFVKGTILPLEPENSRERTLADSLPPRRKLNSVEPGQRVVYGAFIPSQWKQTHRACFGDKSTVLFQLSPVHDVFRASELSQNYITYLTSSASQARPGINFGTPLPSKTTHSSVSAPLGPVSLFIDASLEYGVFSHTADGGGSFHSSISPTRTSKKKPTSTAGVSTTGDWQDRFEIDSLEVWGLGGEEEAQRMRRNQEWEEREAKMRRASILGNRGGDYEGDKEILRMAGLLDHGAMGGSIQ